jgi:hypothetical protein
VLGHSGGSVTAIYNRYGYVKEMRRVLGQWVKELKVWLEHSRVTEGAVFRRLIGQTDVKGRQRRKLGYLSGARARRDELPGTRGIEATGVWIHTRNLDCAQ